MPCFKGLAVSIHTPNGPIPEHSVQRTSRLGRISAYIPVPPAKIPTDSTTGKPEQSTFAISITLLTPNQEIPYSTPKATKDNPDPKPRFVGELLGHQNVKNSSTSPYTPLTTSPNETIAAYIYFDGRAKEEVATLLRKGEETWVNSRWVSVPDKEGGGLAEREFLFREVGLERWLNGLDLDGKDAAATIERRRQKLERRRRKKQEFTGSDDDTNGLGLTKKEKRKSTLRYGADGELEDISDDEGSLDDTGSSEEDDDPIPESAGQIKVALFRVLASGEIKRGEYSPQFDAHDDSEGSEAGEGNANGKADIDHTTSFAKPKTLDPKTISTQTVTGIDPTDKPYAVFTFLYRGERQLQKMGILPGAKSEKVAATAKRRSIAAELPKLGPLKKAGASGFSGFRDTEGRRQSKGKRASDDDDMESDSDEAAGADIIGKMEDINDADVKKESGMLSPEDAERTGQVAEGIRKMKLKRQHSAEPLNSNGVADARKSSKSGSPSTASTPQIGAEELGTSPGGMAAGGGALVAGLEVAKADESFMVGSPMKRQRASMADFDDDIKNRLGNSLTTTSGTIGEILESSGASTANPSGLHFGGALVKEPATADNDEEL